MSDKRQVFSIQINDYIITCTTDTRKETIEEIEKVGINTNKIFELASSINNNIRILLKMNTYQANKLIEKGLTLSIDEYVNF